MCSRVKPRERVKVQKNVRQTNKLKFERFEVKRKSLVAGWCDADQGASGKVSRR